MIPLDTNVISEFMRPEPSPMVAAWMRRQPVSELWLSSVVVAELLAGVKLRASGRRQQAFRGYVEHVVEVEFRKRILVFDLPAATAFSTVRAIRQRIGRPIRSIDAMIAATALSNGAVLATRNTSDFEHCGLQIVNPWL